VLHGGLLEIRNQATLNNERGEKNFQETKTWVKVVKKSYINTPVVHKYINAIKFFIITRRFGPFANIRLFYMFRVVVTIIGNTPTGRCLPVLTFDNYWMNTGCGVVYFLCDLSQFVTIFFFKPISLDHGQQAEKWCDNKDLDISN
jgi:hypothetical protein